MKALKVFFLIVVLGLLRKACLQLLAQLLIRRIIAIEDQATGIFEVDVVVEPIVLL